MAIGDVHGDLDAFVEALRLGGCVRGPESSEAKNGVVATSVLPGGRMVEQAPAGRAGPPPPLAWAGGQTKLVLTGDLLDRGDDELEVRSG